MKPADLGILGLLGILGFREGSLFLNPKPQTLNPKPLQSFRIEVVACSIGCKRLQHPTGSPLRALNKGGPLLPLQGFWSLGPWVIEGIYKFRV